MPISYMPLRILYVFTDLLYLLLITAIPYRKKIVTENIKSSFPQKTNFERFVIRLKFYRHFCDLIAEGIKNLSISERELKKRFVINNPEILNELFEKGKSVVLVSGHYNNWEWLITSQNFYFKHQAMGIGMPMTSKFWDEQINKKRQRFGMKVIHSKNFRQEIKKNNDNPGAILTLSDQSPGDSKKSYWMNFLNQPTAVLFGSEQMAHEYNFAVVFFATRKVKRGHYQLSLQLISDEPKDLAWGQITEKHVKMLEEEIQKAPQFWIWSHKRWKREIPSNLEELKNEQHAKFNKRFKNI